MKPLIPLDVTFLNAIVLIRTNWSSISEILISLYLKALQKMDKMKVEFHLAIASRNISIWNNNVSRIRNRLADSLRKTVAYRAVAEEKSFTKIRDLDQEYTFKGMKGEIQTMMHKMDPVYIREQKAKVEIDRARRVQEETMHKNLKKVTTQWKKDMIQAALRAAGVEAEAKKKEELKELHPDAAWSLTPSPDQAATSTRGGDSPMNIKMPYPLVSENTFKGEKPPGEVSPWKLIDKNETDCLTGKGIKAAPRSNESPSKTPQNKNTPTPTRTAKEPSPTQDILITTKKRPRLPPLTKGKNPPVKKPSRHKIPLSHRPQVLTSIKDEEEGEGDPKGSLLCKSMP